MMYKIIIQKLRFILDRYEKTIISRLTQIRQRRIKYFNHVLQGLVRKLEKSSPISWLTDETNSDLVRMIN